MGIHIDTMTRCKISKAQIKKQRNKKRKKRKGYRRNQMRTIGKEVFGFPIKVGGAFKIWKYANKNRKKCFIGLIRDKKRLADIRKKFGFQKRVAQGEMTSFE